MIFMIISTIISMLKLIHDKAMMILIKHFQKQFHDDIHDDFLDYFYDDFLIVFMLNSKTISMKISRMRSMLFLFMNSMKNSI